MGGEANLYVRARGNKDTGFVEVLNDGNVDSRPYMATSDPHTIWETKPGPAFSGTQSKSQGRNAYTKLTTAESAAGGNKISSKKSRNPAVVAQGPGGEPGGPYLLTESAGKSDHLSKTLGNLWDA